MERTPLMRAVEISRSYPGVQALSRVNFDILPGEVHCLVGENGAGKSTLMRILAGAERPETGSLEFEGRSYTGWSPTTALRLGVSQIYQERDLLSQLSVAQNVFLGHEPRTAGLFLARQKMRAATAALFEQMGVAVDPHAVVGSLSAGDQQFVQIARALSRPCRLLIMDEPGAILSPHELESLFAVVRGLVARDCGVVYISHRLEEVHQIGDRVSVMRQGRLVATLPARATTAAKLAELMVGKSVDTRAAAPTDTAVHRARPVVLSVRDLRWRRKVNGVSFDLHEGEILGIAGFVGSGRSEILGCIVGSLKADGGSVTVNGQLLKNRNPRDSVRHGIGLVPEDRRDSGLLLGRPMSDNIVIASLDQFTNWGVLNRRKTVSVAETYRDRLSIKAPSVATEVGVLSGGNQQKVILARWLASGIKVLLLDEPTRGVDVGARREIYLLVRQLATQGVSLVLVSSDLDEVMLLSDRVIVLADGHVCGELQRGGSAEDVIEMAVSRVT